MIVKTSCPLCFGNLEYEAENYDGHFVSCPHCLAAIPLGTSRTTAPTPEKSRTKGFLAMINFPFLGLVGLIILFLFIYVCFVTAPSSVGPQVHYQPPPPPRPSKTVKAGFAASVHQLEVRNKDSFHWVSMTIYVNGTPPEGYSYTLPFLMAGDTKEIPLNLFTKDSGERFQPEAMAVRRLWIGGNGFDYIAYGF